MVLSRIPLRLVLGIGLVASAITGVWYVLSEASSTREVYTAAIYLPAGETIESGDVAIVEIPASPVLEAYFARGESPVGLRAMIPLSPRELIPRSGVTDRVVSDDSVVTIELAIGLPDWLVAGAIAEVWVAPAGGENAYREPFVLAPRVRIARVRQDEGFAADTVTTRVDVLVPRRHLPGVVFALANRHFLVLTPHQGIDP